MSKIFASILFCSVLLSACKDESRQGYVELNGRVFIFNPRVATATYVVTLNVLKPLPVGASVEALFEDPAGGEKIPVEHVVRNATPRIDLESPSLLCIKKGRRYAFDVTVLSENRDVLQKLSSSIESSLDQSVMPDLPLVVGPEYQPNPALKGNPGGKLVGGNGVKCPV